ncbi:DNA translocase FtsK 4TM domain-containing protein [Nostoc sp.]|uniref:DNA translocase FtsK 4TM domain-containing protein n=1 Tax=Nostoc sp. TaxID=1180 RepID=UPI002FF770EC
MILLIALAGVVAIVGISSLNWRLAVKATLIIVVLEGVLRKWVLPQASDMIYFLKDLVLLGAYLRYYLGSELKYPLRLTFFNIALFMSVGWCVFQVFNPSLGSPIVGFFGLKTYLFYIALMWMLPNLFQSEEELYKFLRTYLVLLIPVCILAIAQFYAPINSPINVYAGGVQGQAVVDGNARVTGTFPYILGYSTYLSICFTIVIPLLSVPQTKIWSLLTLVEFFLVAGTSLMTGARGLLLFEILFILAYFCLLWFTKPSIAVRSTKHFILPIVLITAVVPIFFNKAIEGFYKRATTSDNFTERVFSTFSEPGQAMQWKGFDSYGIGATHQAVSTLRKILGLSLGESSPPSEGEMGRIVLEIGLFGFLIWYGLRLILIFSLLRVFLKLKTPFLRNLALAVFLLHAISLTTQLVFNNTLAIYYWFFSGFLFLLPELEYRQSLSNRHQGNQPYV